MMRIQLERFLALAAGGLVAAGLAAGCTAANGGDDGAAGSNWLTGKGGSSTGGVTISAGSGGVATGGTAGTATGGTATGGTPATCIGDTTLATPPPTCADLPYRDVTCANAADTRPPAYSICLDYATVGVTRAGVMEELVACLEVLPDDAVGACEDSTATAAWGCVDSVERAACAVDESASLCVDLNEVCPSDITTTRCTQAFNTITSAARNAAYTCMMATPDCIVAWDGCFPTPI